MTITEITPAALDLRDLSEAELLDVSRAGDVSRAAALREAARRDREDTLAKTRAKGAEVYAEGEQAAYAQYRQAEEFCRGKLLSAAGRAAHDAGEFGSEFALWRMPAGKAERYSSEELRDYFLFVAPRITPAAYVKQRAAEKRGEYRQARDEREARNGLDGLPAGALRREATAGEAPQDGSGRPVLSGRRPAGQDTGTSQDRTAGRATGPVQRDGRIGHVGLVYAAVRESVRAAERHQRERQATSAVAVLDGQVMPRQAIPAEPVDGAQLLAETAMGLGHFGVWPSEAALITAALWAAQRHARNEKTGLPIWQYSPHLFLTSTDGGSGKSWMGRLVAKLSPNGKMLVEPTKASLVRLIAKRATVVATEMDVLVGNGGRNKWFTGIANAAYEPDVSTWRVDHGKELEIPLMGGMILDGLDSVEKSTGAEMRTLMSRCIKIRVKRAPDGYQHPRFDEDARAAFAHGNEKLAGWMAQEVRDGIGKAVPEMPEGLGNRPADLWEPLLAVADAAGGSWPDWARQACAELESPGMSEDREKEDAYRAALSSWAADGEDEDA